MTSKNSRHQCDELITHRSQATGSMTGRMGLTWQLTISSLLAIAISLQATSPAQALFTKQRAVFDNSIQFFNYKDHLVGNCNTFGTGPGTNSDVDRGFTLGPLSDGKSRRTALMKQLIADYAISPVHAAGIVGNFMHESGGINLPPDINEGGRKGPPAFSGGYGWAQWTGPRQRTFIDFAVSAGFMASKTVNATDAANYGYLKKELATGYKTTIPQLKRETTTDGATRSFEATFESAGTPNLPSRQAKARQALAEFSGNGGNSNEGGTGGTGSAGGACSNGPVSIIGGNAFPLKTTKRGIPNRSIFSNGTTNRGGHPYTAYDIYAAPGTEVVGFIGGEVRHIGSDKCGGPIVSIYNAESNLTVSYLHLQPGSHVAQRNIIQTGGRVGTVGEKGYGCGTAHLHIDVAKGTSRPGCKRENCPPQNAAQFVDIGPPLFKTYQALPD